MPTMVIAIGFESRVRIDLESRESSLIDKQIILLPTAEYLNLMTPNPQAKFQLTLMMYCYQLMFAIANRQQVCNPSSMESRFVQTHPTTILSHCRALKMNQQKLINVIYVPTTKWCLQMEA